MQGAILEYLLESLGPDRKIDFKAQGVAGGSDGKDDYAYDTGRLRRVIEIAAEKSGWAKRKPAPGRALGICAHRSFLTYVASVVDLEVDARGSVHIHRVDTAVDPGRIVNADRVRSQFEGAAVFGTSAALMGEISFRNGRITQSNFHNHPVARMSEAPRETHVYIVPSDAPPAGVGEPEFHPSLRPFATQFCGDREADSRTAGQENQARVRPGCHRSASGLDIPSHSKQSRLRRPTRARARPTVALIRSSSVFGRV